MLHLRDKEKKDTGSVLLLKCPLPTATARKKKTCKGAFVFSFHRAVTNIHFTFCTRLLWIWLLRVWRLGLCWWYVSLWLFTLVHWNTGDQKKGLVYKYSGHCLMTNKLVLQHLHEDQCCRGALRWRCVSARPDRPWWQRHHYRDMWGQRGILIQLLRSGDTKLLKHLQRNLKRRTAVFMYMDTH